MAKRYTDTEKWKDEWYLSLSNDYKIIWQWLLDNCSHSGFCKPSISFLNMLCGLKVTEDEIINHMDGRLLKVDKQWFIPKFIKFQYPTLISNKPVIVSVVKDVISNNCQELLFDFGEEYVIVAQSLDNHLEMIKDKDKYKDKVKDKINTLHNQVKPVLSENLLQKIKIEKNENPTNGKPQEQDFLTRRLLEANEAERIRAENSKAANTAN